MSRLPFALLAVLALLVAGCGGGSEPADPVEQVPAAQGLRDRVAEARAATAAGFPTVQGRTLQELADETQGGPEVGLATSVFTTGRQRVAFGVIDGQGQFIYGPTAVYVARRPGSRAQGPFVAPADVLVTEPPYRSRQAATEEDPFAAVYAARVAFDRPGDWSVLTVTRSGDALLGAASTVTVIDPEDDRVPRVGERAPAVETDTLATASGDIGSIDTRVPPTDMHRRSFADVLGEKPATLLFATPQLCQSRVCGPVVDVAAQLRSRYGDRMEFIHQEVYVDNRPEKGLREPLERFNLPTEPWLFVVDEDGRITARLEGSFGLDAFEEAVRSGL